MLGAMKLGAMEMIKFAVVFLAIVAGYLIHMNQEYILTVLYYWLTGLMEAVSAKAGA